MLSHLRASLVLIGLFCLVTGVLYPLAVTAVGGLIFPIQAAGSLIRSSDGRIIGSSLIAQGFTRPEYLHPRGSAAGSGFDATSSSGSNLGPMDKKLIDRVAADAAAFRRENPGASVPADAVTQSGSGLDPDISPENASAQAVRVARARGASLAAVQAVIARSTEAPLFGFIGQPRVNVLLANQAFDQVFGHPKA